MITSTYGDVIRDPCGLVAFSDERVHKLFANLSGSHGSALKTFLAHSYPFQNGLHWIRVGIVPPSAGAATVGAFMIPPQFVAHSDVVFRVEPDLTARVVRDRAHHQATRTMRLFAWDPRMALPIMSFNRPLVAPDVTINKYGCYVD